MQLVSIVGAGPQSIKIALVYRAIQKHNAAAILHSDRRRLLHFFPEDKPLALHLGGSDPAEIAEASGIAEQYGYDGINLNIGWPSDRAPSGRFGACLMTAPALVARCVNAMSDAVDLPVL